MSDMHDDERRSRRFRADDDDDRERVRGIGGGYDPYDDRRRGGERAGYGRGYGDRWEEEEYRDRRASRYGGQDRNDESSWRRDSGDDRYRYGRNSIRAGSGAGTRGGAGWYGTRDYERFALGGRYAGTYGSESMGGTVPGVATMAGKGPKGYKRSDDRIREDVCNCLTDDPELDASSIEVEVKDCEVTLVGTVDSRQAKRHAEELIDRVSGVKDVHNGLRVQEGSSKRSATTANARSG